MPDESFSYTPRSVGAGRVGPGHKKARISQNACYCLFTVIDCETCKEQKCLLCFALLSLANQWRPAQHPELEGRATRQGLVAAGVKGSCVNVVLAGGRRWLHSECREASGWYQFRGG